MNSFRRSRITQLMRDRSACVMACRAPAPSRSRVAPLGAARVQHAGDVRVVHQGQRLSFDLEARDHVLGVGARLDDLQRHEYAGPVPPAPPRRRLPCPLRRSGCAAGRAPPWFRRTRPSAGLKRSRFLGVANQVVERRVGLGASRSSSCFDILSQLGVRATGLIEEGALAYPRDGISRASRKIWLADRIPARSSAATASRRSTSATSFVRRYSLPSWMTGCAQAGPSSTAALNVPLTRNSSGVASIRATRHPLRSGTRGSHRPPARRPSRCALALRVQSRAFHLILPVMKSRQTGVPLFCPSPP